VSPEARFLRGKLVRSNWDVEELKALTKEIEEADRFTTGLFGMAVIRTLLRFARWSSGLGHGSKSVLLVVRF
jgi:hypothetical protein